VIIANAKFCLKLLDIGRNLKSLVTGTTEMRKVTKNLIVLLAGIFGGSSILIQCHKHLWR